MELPARPKRHRTPPRQQKARHLRLARNRVRGSGAGPKCISCCLSHSLWWRLCQLGVLAIWESQTAFQNELDSVRERHLLVARNLTSTMSRYVKDLKATFPLAPPKGQ